MAGGLVKGEGFAVDASVMEANASRYHGKAPEEIVWAEPERQTRAVREYLSALEAEDPDDLFDRAHTAEQIGDIAEAERLYRLLMKSDPTDASAPFNLGNMLRASSRIVEAEAALRAATRANPAFAEAWYNLADLLDDQGRSEVAVECLRKALVVAPGYIDAMFNLALMLQQKGAYPEAADYWRQYLTSDHASEWAARARRSLKFCEIQVNSLTCCVSSHADFRPGGLTFYHLADRRFLLPAIREIIPRTPVIGRRININWFSDGRRANSVAFSGHALGINGVISHLQ